MLSMPLQCCIVLVMHIRLNVVVVLAFEQRSLIFLPHMHLADVTMTTSTINKKQNKDKLKLLLPRECRLQSTVTIFTLQRNSITKFFQEHLKLCFRGPF